MQQTPSTSTAVTGRRRVSRLLCLPASWLSGRAGGNGGSSSRRRGPVATWRRTADGPARPPEVASHSCAECAHAVISTSDRIGVTG
ncbi:hypothetical protein NP493_915g00021 [Ridgeia piscesae]|uniref:Uncharacterized protein n=1 Tax=Ridgeia piscesae TaxID=27915 RepID=A0AAD9KLM8_RIDPI|nr:hypothetical protein NP493_915g00021 [Ridgeia piscesae]